MYSNPWQWLAACSVQILVGFPSPVREFSSIHQTLTQDRMLPQLNMWHFINPKGVGVCSMKAFCQILPGGEVCQRCWLCSFQWTMQCRLWGVLYLCVCSCACVCPPLILVQLFSLTCHFIAPAYKANTRIVLTLPILFPHPPFPFQFINPRLLFIPNKSLIEAPYYVAESQDWFGWTIPCSPSDQILSRKPALPIRVCFTAFWSSYDSHLLVKQVFRRNKPCVSMTWFNRLILKSLSSANPCLYLVQHWTCSWVINPRQIKHYITGTVRLNVA